GKSLRGSAAAVNSQLFVAGARLGRRSPTLRQTEHLEDADPVAQREGNDAADADLLARLFHALAIDADMARGDQRLGQCAALHQPDAVQVAVEPHVFFNFASSAKACEPEPRRSPRGGRRPRHFHASPALVKPTSAISLATASSDKAREVASSASTGSAPPAERTLRAWLARRSARSMRSHSRPSRR